nr:PIN domain-containing protein [uncultured Pseudomonas sp.]
MKKGFPGYFANNNDDLDKLWDECIFILDANVLLSLYRYSDSTRSDLLSVFNSLSARLWIPHQVAHEYLTNRLNVIGEQVKTYDETIKKTDTLKKALENVNQHPFVKPETLTTCRNTFTALTDELAENRLIHEKRISSDEIKDRLEKLLENRVGEEYSREQIEAALIDGKSRYDEKIPPGYGDAKKGGDSSLFVERCRPYGDYIVWLQIIDKANVAKKSVIFVTGDVKEDWWVSFQGKTVGPQPLLVQEFLSKTGQPFYMYTPDRFLERASTYLKQETSQQTLNEIRDVREDESDIGLLDKALNGAWPSYRSAESLESNTDQNYAFDTRTGLEAFHHHWSEISESEKLRLEYNTLVGHGFELRDQLEFARSEKKSLTTLLKRIAINPDKHPQSKTEEIKQEMKRTEQKIRQLEEEISDLRGRVWAVTKRIKSIDGDTSPH